MQRSLLWSFALTTHTGRHMYFGKVSHRCARWPWFFRRHLLWTETLLGDRLVYTPRTVNASQHIKKKNTKRSDAFNVRHTWTTLPHSQNGLWSGSFPGQQTFLQRVLVFTIFFFFLVQVLAPHKFNENTPNEMTESWLPDIKGWVRRLTVDTNALNCLSYCVFCTIWHASHAWVTGTKITIVRDAVFPSDSTRR